MLDGSVGRYERSQSDWVGFAHGKLSDSIHAGFDIHYNQNESRAESYAATVRYNPEPAKY